MRRTFAGYCSAFTITGVACQQCEAPGVKVLLLSAYAAQSQQLSLLEAQMVSLYSALAADCILFNSTYNMDSFLAGC
ncbi:MAG: hypothetical protein DRQ65_02010, partial [Gammaproteobacteria bacterium]